MCVNSLDTGQILLPVKRHIPLLSDKWAARWTPKCLSDQLHVPTNSGFLDFITCPLKTVPTFSSQLYLLLTARTVLLYLLASYLVRSTRTSQGKWPPVPNCLSIYFTHTGVPRNARIKTSKIIVCVGGDRITDLSGDCRSPTCHVITVLPCDWLTGSSWG